MLEEMQHMFRKYVHGGTINDQLKESVVSSGIQAEQRLQIYQNNFQITLTDNLASIFPFTEAFVGEVFLRGVIKEFIASNPPKGAALNAYGSGFADFFQVYEHADDVAYLADLIRLEWAVHSLQFAETAYAEMSSFVVNPNIITINSEYPLLNLWLVAQGQLVPEAVHLDQGGQCVVVVQQYGEIKLHTLSRDENDLIKELGNSSGGGVQIQMLNIEERNRLLSKGIILTSE